MCVCLYAKKPLVWPEAQGLWRPGFLGQVPEALEGLVRPVGAPVPRRGFEGFGLQGSRIRGFQGLRFGVWGSRALGLQGSRILGSRALGS